MGCRGRDKEQRDTKTLLGAPGIATRGSWPYYYTTIYIYICNNKAIIFARQRNITKSSGSCPLISFPQQELMDGKPGVPWSAHIYIYMIYILFYSYFFPPFKTISEATELWKSRARGWISRLLDCGCFERPHRAETPAKPRVLRCLES